MSREDVIQLARDVADKDKVDPIHGDPPFVVLTPEELERFYEAAFKAGAEAEREACEHDIEDCRGGDDSAEYSNGIGTALAAIRARGAT